MPTPVQRGVPGGHAAHLAAVRQRRALRFKLQAGLAAVAAGGVVLLLPTSVGVGLAVVLAGAAWWSWLRADQTVGASAKASAGVVSEQRVAATLARRSRAAAIGHGVLLGARGDADHVVMGPWAAVVETKTGRGKLRYHDATMTVGGRKLPGDPVAQARRQSFALSRKLGVVLAGQHYPVAAIVCVVDMAGRPKRIGDVTVCSLKHLPRILRRLPRVMTASDARLVLEQHLDTTD